MSLFRNSIITVGGLLVLQMSVPAMISPVRAADEAQHIQVASQFGVGYLPLVVMGQDQLWEKHATKYGINLRADFTQIGGGATVNDALLSDSVQIVAAGVAPMLLLWDRTRGNVDVRAIAALNINPLFLVTNKPEVKTIKDLTDADRIAVPALRSGSIQAIFLAMAAEREFGKGQSTKLDNLAVAMQLPDAYAALISGGTPVSAAFLSSPFQERALKNPKLHKIADSFEIQGGPATVSAIYAKAEFVKRNPQLVMAFYEALNEAIESIRTSPRVSIDKYIKATSDKSDPELLLGILRDDRFAFDPTPKRTLPLAEFMARVGALKQPPKSWKEYFFETAHSFDGS